MLLNLFKATLNNNPVISWLGVGWKKNGIPRENHRPEQVNDKHNLTRLVIVIFTRILFLLILMELTITVFTFFFTYTQLEIYEKIKIKKK